MTFICISYIIVSSYLTENKLRFRYKVQTVNNVYRNIGMSCKSHKNDAN
jgi:hypothetical protein